MRPPVPRRRFIGRSQAWVTRGFLGVAIQEVTPELAKAFKVPEGKDALVGDVAPGSPGSNAGLQKGDVIEEIDGEGVTSANDLRLRIASTSPVSQFI